MNKDCCAKGTLSLADRFNLFLSHDAIERELTRIKRPVVNVEELPKKKEIKKQERSSNGP